VRVLDAVNADPPSILDVGCGNGRLARFVLETRKADYLGIDTSAALVGAARTQTAAQGARFEVRDVADAPDGPFDLVAVFGFMHHVPGFASRAELLETLGGRLTPGGRLATTFWRFGNDPRFEGRLRSLDGEVDARELEPGDHLLLWGDGEDTGRYCHFSDDDELERLVAHLEATGLTLADRFRSDGRSGEFNEYLVWTRQ
jgi:SAM-dependent methyltransferase